MSEPNPNIGWDDREATEDKEALERWYHRQETHESKRRRRAWAFWIILCVAVDLGLVFLLVRHP